MGRINASQHKVTSFHLFPSAVYLVVVMLHLGRHGKRGNLVHSAADVHWWGGVLGAGWEYDMTVGMVGAKFSGYLSLFLRGLNRVQRLS